MSDFQAKLERSKVYEMAFSSWLQSRGWYVQPNYDYTGSNGEKAPRLVCGNQWLVLPDLSACKHGRFLHFEIKLKQEAVLNRKWSTVVTGLPLRHWNDYLKVKYHSGHDVHIVFIHQKEAGVRIAEIDDLRSRYLSHEWHGNQMDYGGTIFFKFYEIPQVLTLQQLDQFKPKENFHAHSRFN